MIEQGGLVDALCVGLFENRTLSPALDDQGGILLNKFADLQVFFGPQGIGINAHGALPEWERRKPRLWDLGILDFEYSNDAAASLTPNPRLHAGAWVPIPIRIGM